MSDSNIHEVSLRPPSVRLNPGAEYASEKRRWQGIPGIERTANGILYAAWYTGGDGEGPDNHLVLVRSEDNGRAWSAPILVIDPLGPVRAYDPLPWIDPLGRLWLFWAQCHTFWNGRGGVWFIRCDQPDAQSLEWSSPRRIANGVMMNKPYVRNNGEWLFPIAVWGSKEPRLPELKHEALSSIYATTDNGETFAWRGGADVPHRCYDEHMVIERRDGSLWMLVRTHYGLGQSTSLDAGLTWSPGRPTDIAGPNTRFHLRRLKSGRVLLVNHVGFTGRSHLTASLSEDEGRTWTAHLLLDERKDVSYPDATESADGRIWIVYDRERSGAKEILHARITEADILAGRQVTAESYLRRLVSKAGSLI